MGTHKLTPLRAMRIAVGHAACGLKIDVLRHLPGIVSEWWDLFRRCPDATPFQSPAWLLPWWEFFGHGEPLVVTARRNEVLCGLALLYIYETEREGPQLFFVGKAVSDYLDVLIAPDEQRTQVAQQLLDYAFVNAGNWRSTDLDRLPSTSPLLHVQHPPGVRAIPVRDGVCPQLTLSGRRLEDFVKRKSTLINLRNRRRRAERAGSVEFVTADSSTVDELMGDLHRLHSKRWNLIGVAGMFSDQIMTAFLTEAARQLQTIGMLRLHAMRLNGDSIAVSFGMLHEGRAYLYNFGFETAYSTIAPATQVIAFAIEQAAREGAYVFDFLQGDEPYKFATWGAEPHYTYRLRYFASASEASNALFTQTEREGDDMARDSRNDKDERSPERRGDLEAQPDDLGNDPAQVGLDSAGQDGSLQQVSSVRDATEESPEELAETGQDLEADAVEGVEDAADHPERPVHTHEEYGSPEDVPPRNREDEAA